ncbi:dCTP deaminase [Kribbella sp. NPDC050459]|uniref:dCTP deaminase n=1 Tax=Kribbella sp. NPDC050459 TaxID=3155785 RepID=UPI0033CE367B
MADYASTLSRSLLDRAGSLGSYVRSLQASHSRTDDAYNAALEMFYLYTDLVGLQVEADLAMSANPAMKNAVLEMRLQDFSEKENLFDERFARGKQSDVPRALRTIARRELRAHGLNDFEPVLTVGPPDSFETHRSDLGSYLFRNFTIRWREFNSTLPIPRLAVISVPYIEGTRALWYPISIGHELAHVRIEALRGYGKGLPNLGGLIDDEDAELAALIDEASPLGGGGELGVVQHLRQILGRWVEEIACDLNAVRLYGPAGLSAVAEFLSALRRRRGPESGAPQDASSTHPSLGTRIGAMFRLMELMGQSPTSPGLDAWRDYLKRTNGRAAPKAGYLTNVLDRGIDKIAASVMSWGEMYTPAARVDVISWLRDELLSGVPGGTHCLSPAALGEEVSVADVVNASWHARERLVVEQPKEDEVAPLEGVTFEGREQRVVLDDLASKAIDTLEFCALWRAAGESVLPMPPVNAPAVELSGGVMSRAAIEGRIALGDERRIVVTPLLPEAVQAAGIDVRLSPDFIVFRHSATKAFDPVSAEQDPRNLQEHVVKTWGESFILHPRELVLASTLEYIVLPDDVVAQVVTRSSYGRLGLTTATAVQVQPRSRGCVTLELVNNSDTPIALTPGARIAQLTLFHVEHASPTSSGKYWYPVGPEFSKVREDPDLDALRYISQTASWSSNSDQTRWSVRQVEDILAFEYVGSLNQVINIQNGLEAYGYLSEIRTTAEVGLSEESGNAQIAGGFTYLEYALVGSASLTMLVSAILRLVRGLARGVVIRIDAKGDAKISRSKDVPRGTIVILPPPTGPKAQRAQIEVMDVGAQDKLESLLRRLRSRPRDGRWTDQRGD